MPIPLNEDAIENKSTSELDTSAVDLSFNSKLTLAAEDFVVEKKVVQTGILRVSKHTRTREAHIVEELLKEDAVVETIPIGKYVLEMPPTRQEGDTTIIPIVEEVLYTERRLMLKEEVRITRRRTKEQYHDRVTLRYQEAVVSRVPADNVSR